MLRCCRGVAVEPVVYFSAAVDRICPQYCVIKLCSARGFHLARPVFGEPSSCKDQSGWEERGKKDGQGQWFSSNNLLPEETPQVKLARKKEWEPSRPSRSLISSPIPVGVVDLLPH
jgi:hypothetical protein